MRTEVQKGAGVVDGLLDKRVIEVDGSFIALDVEGYLVDPADWSEALAEKMATMDGMALGADHWLLIDFLHRFYAEYAIAPELPVLARNLCKDQHDCRWTRRYIKELFPGGAKTACRYAGLPAPVGRSCG
jgi:tRNA 2-thiouridine synthesizing protein E